MSVIKGRVWRFGENIDTDQIYPGRYLLGAVSAEEISSHAMEGNPHPRFRNEARAGDIIVAGDNFGCGSSREHAALALKYRGISVVISPSFGRIFYRNSFSIGMPLLEADQVEEIQEGDEIEVDLKSGKIVNLSSQKQYQAKPIPEVLMNLYRKGGLKKILEEQFIK
jgi:3-isopropylmalate/(R)-2-methylmalate dehydratase small subunit